MERFIARHQESVAGVLSGFDRLLFRGTLRSICYVEGLEKFLSSQRVLFKDFGKYSEQLSNQVKLHAEQLAQQQGRPFRYLPSSATRKEEVAAEIMAQDKVTRGLVCILSCVEPCQTFNLRRDPARKRLQLEPAVRKCLHLYFYFVDREFGLMHVRLQTWIPFTIHVCLNGRSYLQRQLDKLGIGYEMHDNCFTQIDDLPRAQTLLDELTPRRWERFLKRLAERVNPLLDPDGGVGLFGYYWSLRQGEYATDVMFQSAEALQALYPALVNHAIQQFSCDDIIRYLGRRTNSRFKGEVVSDLKRRVEGIRIKHWVEENSIKMYDKGSVLRIETTINRPGRFKAPRTVTRKGKSCQGWLPVRVGIIDIPQRVAISHAANQRYLEALSVVGLPAPTHEILDPVSRRITRSGRQYRPLRPLTAEEGRLFRLLLRGEHVIQGIRNPEIRRELYPEDEKDPVRQRRASGRVTRWFRLLRAHGLIRKVSHTRYYRLTVKGNRVMSMALKLRELDVSLLAV